MPATRKILVVAPDQELRRSIAFVLEAEGFRVTLSDRIPWAGMLPPDTSCAVVDETAEGNLGRLLALDKPVILLLDRPRPLPKPLADLAIEKPLLGRRLVDAVAAAVLYGDSAAAGA